MHFQDIPRDTQLLIMAKFDMETRIKMNMIGKLKVPDALVKRLETYNKTYTTNYDERLKGNTTHVITLDIDNNKKYECYYDMQDDQAYWYMSTTATVYPSLIRIYPR
jgi:hypothetical protein